MPPATSFEVLPAENAERWGRYGSTEVPNLMGHLSISLAEVRSGYCRMTMPLRPEHMNLAGVLHGGSIASLLDTVVVPAVGGVYNEPRNFMTLDMHVTFRGAVTNEDLVATGWVTQRGRSIVFCKSAVDTAAGRRVAEATLVYRVSSPKQ
jgi:uncharacterized protein (TIGR00369 family)